MPKETITLSEDEENYFIPFRIFGDRFSMEMADFMNMKNYPGEINRNSMNEPYFIHAGNKDQILKILDWKDLCHELQKENSISANPDESRTILVITKDSIRSSKGLTDLYYLNDRHLNRHAEFFKKHHIYEWMKENKLKTVGMLRKAIKDQLKKAGYYK